MLAAVRYTADLEARNRFRDNDEDKGTIPFCKPARDLSKLYCGREMLLLLGAMIEASNVVMRKYTMLCAECGVGGAID